MAQVEVLAKSEVQDAIDAFNAAKSDLNDGLDSLETSDAQVQSSIANATALAPVTFSRQEGDDLTEKPSSGSPSTNDVSYYYKGNSFLQLVIWDGDSWEDHGTPIPTNKTLQNYYKIKDEDVQKMWGFIQSGGVRFAILGDSTEAGRPGSSSYYAETNRMGEFSHASLLAHALMTNDPNWIPPSEKVYDVVPAKKSNTNLGDSLLAHHNLVVSEDPELNFTVRTLGKSQSVFTVYILERTSDAAPEFDVTIYDSTGTQVSTETFDSYVDQVSFGAVATEDIKGRVKAVQISIQDEGANLREFQVTLNNLTLVDRGDGVAADGTLIVLGYALGQGCSYMNYAVGSMTLKDESTANVGRGVTTSGQLTKATTFDANVFFIGFGTNDSKDGVSDVATFKSEYLALIADIYTHDENALIILATDPRGAAESIYENNYLYNQVIREIALEQELSVFDVESLTDKFPSTNIVDDVHPSSEGYQTLGHSLARAFNCANVGTVNVEVDYEDSSSINNEVFVHVIDPVGNSDFTGSLVEIASFSFNKNINDKDLELGAKLLLGRSGSDLDETYLEVSVIAYPNEDLSGTASSKVVIDAATISEDQVSAKAKASVTLIGFYQFQGNKKSVKVTVSGKNYQLQTAGGNNHAYARKLSGAISVIE